MTAYKSPKDVASLKQGMTPLQKRRAEFDRLLASLPVPQHTTLLHVFPVKQKPASGVMGSI